ncbi:ketopantoate reductase family protein [Allopusillimonas ginsengisoli]|uniref:ketopantoate reductase family protein n=1 Tax=Allopusillimonas ginsengisoli TaxID=453575 RepID=UPI0039C052F5
MHNANMPRIGIIGAGAIGCMLAARFANAGCEVKLAARANAAAVIRESGVQLIAFGTEMAAQITVIESPQELLDLDYIFIAVKQQSLASAVRHWLPSLPCSVTVVPAINGIPWWFLSAIRKVSDPLEDVQGTELATLLPDAQILGAAVYLTAYSPTPGVAVQGTRNRIIIGELDGTVTSRATTLKMVCETAGMDCDISTSICPDVWMKAAGNAVFNPLSVLSGADMAAMLADDHISQLALSMLQESFELGQRIGMQLAISPEEKLQQAQSAGNAQTSMLQDYLKGKPLEVEAIIGSIVKLGSRYEVEMPFTKAVYGLIQNAALNNPFSTIKSNSTEEPTT